MASTWFEQFAAGLADIESRRGAVARTQEPRDIAMQVLAMQRPANISNPGLGNGGGKFSATSTGKQNKSILESIGGYAGNAAGTIFDFLSRPLYGVMNTALYEAEQNKKQKEKLNSAMQGMSADDKTAYMKEHFADRGWDIGGDLGAFWRGLKGENKTVGQDVLRAQGTTSPFGLAVGGFALDVAADPINLVNPLAVARKLGITPVGKAMKIDTGAKNVIFKTTDTPVVNPTTKIDLDLSRTGKAVVPNTPLGKKAQKAYLSAVNSPKAAEVGDVAEVVPEKVLPDPADFRPSPVSELLQLGPAPEATFVVDSAGVAQYKPWHNTSERMGLEARIRQMEAARANIFKPLEARNYPKSTKIEAPFRESIKIRSEKYMEDVVEDAPNSPLNKKPEDFFRDAIRSAANTHAIEGAKGEGGFKLFGRTGAALPNHTSRTRISWGETLKLVQAKKLPKTLENVTIKDREGNVKPLTQFIDELKADAVRASNQVISDTGEDLTKITRQVEKERAVADYVTERMTPSEFMAWRQKYIEQGISDAHLTQISRMTGLGKKATETKIQQILGGVGERTFDSPEALKAAVKQGLLTDKGMAALRIRLSDAGVKNLGQLDRDLTKLRQELLKAQDKQPVVRATRGRPAKAKAEEAAVKAEAHSDAAYTDIENEILNTPSVISDTATKVEKAFNGDVSDFVRPKVQINEAQAAGVAKALKITNEQDFFKPKHEWTGSITRKGARRTSSTPGEGNANFIEGFNSGNQYTMIKSIIGSASAIVRGTAPVSRPAAMFDTVVPMLQAAEATLRERGIMPVLGFGKTGMPLSLGDILTALPRDYVEKYLFMPGKTLDVTQFLRIAEQFVHVSTGNRDIATAGMLVDELIRKASPKGRKSALTVAVEKNPDLGREAYQDTVKAFTEAAPQLIDSLTTNLARATVKSGQEIKELTNEVIDDFNAFVNNPSFGAADIIGYTEKIGKTVKEAAATRSAKVAPESIQAATEAVVAHAVEKLSPEAMAAMATARKSAIEFGKLQGEAFGKRANIAAKVLESAESEAYSVLKMQKMSVLDLGLKADYTFGIATLRKMFPHLSNADIRPILTARMSVNQNLAKKYAGLLGNISQKYSKDQIRQAFVKLQAGQIDAADNGLGVELSNAVHALFASADSAQYGLIARNGLRAEHVNEKMARVGIPDKFRLDPKNIEGSWVKWDVEDPLDLLSKYHAAVGHALAEQQLGATIVSKFGSKVPFKGGVRLSDTKGKSKIYALVGGDTYFHPDIARQLHAVDATLADIDKGLGSSKFLHMIDGAMHMYKAGLTIYRPGHHTRNMVGDMWFSSLDGVRGSSYKKAVAVLARASDNYKDYDALAALQQGFKDSVNGPPKTIVTMRYKGKDVPLTPDQIYKLGFDSGILPDYSILEDINFGEVSQSTDIAAKLRRVSPAKGKVHRAATGLSEYRDHYVRMAHFISNLEKNPNLVGNTLEDALKSAGEVAGNRVRKWHPDGSDLSQWEKRYARRTILFYSWMRKAIPLVVEAAAAHPGRVMLYPKAVYNIAEANGIDLESYSNPFPTDQLFPSYIADSVQGPQAGEAGSYWGVKPGIPIMDIMDDYGASPKHTLGTLGGSLNPLLKIPAEVTFGRDIRTGAPIKDATDYVDRQIPNASYVDKIAGSLLGSSTGSRSLSSGFTQETYGAPSNVGYESGTGLSGNENTFLNWLLGGGITDYSKPSSIKSAQFELRDFLRSQGQ